MKNLGMYDEAAEAHRAGDCRFDTCALCWAEHEALMSFVEDDDPQEANETLAPPLALHLDPEVASAFMGQPVEVVQWKAEAKAVYLSRTEIEGKVRERAEKAIRLTCAALTTPDAYHVTGGTDPDGHTVDLRAEWGLRCTCGSHMMSYAFCKHLIRVELERGEYLYDRWPSFEGPGACYKPGIFSRAVQVDLENAAYRAAKREAGAS